MGWGHSGSLIEKVTLLFGAITTAVFVAEPLSAVEHSGRVGSAVGDSHPPAAPRHPARASPEHFDRQLPQPHCQCFADLMHRKQRTTDRSACCVETSTHYCQSKD